MLSQNTNIDLGRKTVTLDEQKSITVAEGLKNEQRLREVNAEQLEIIRQLKDSIQALAKRNIKSSETIEAQNAQILSLSKDIQRLSTLQLNLTEEKKSHQGRLFAQFHYQLNNPYYKSGDFSAIYISRRYSYGVSVNPMNKDILYGAHIGISIF